MQIISSGDVWRCLKVAVKKVINQIISDKQIKTGRWRVNVATDTRIYASSYTLARAHSFFFLSLTRSLILSLSLALSLTHEHTHLYSYLHKHDYRDKDIIQREFSYNSSSLHVSYQHLRRVNKDTEITKIPNFANCGWSSAESCYRTETRYDFCISALEYRPCGLF